MPRVLIVDDSETASESIQHHLLGHSIEAVIAHDAFEGLRKLKEHPEIELVIADFNMPNMDGLTMVEKIRYEQGNSTVKVLMLTTEDCQELKQRASSLGVVGWVVKPITAKFAEIIATVFLSS